MSLRAKAVLRWPDDSDSERLAFRPLQLFVFRQGRAAAGRTAPPCAPARRPTACEASVPTGRTEEENSPTNASLAGPAEKPKLLVDLSVH